jgi:hypothetical protein
MLFEYGLSQLPIFLQARAVFRVFFARDDAECKHSDSPFLAVRLSAIRQGLVNRLAGVAAERQPL